VPDEVAGEHADEHVGADPVVEAVVDRAQLEVVGLEVAEVAFHVGFQPQGAHQAYSEEARAVLLA
jgi:hypothetical protein